MTRTRREAQEYVDAALALIDERGHTALTARVLAQRLGVVPSAVYAHFDDMETLIDAAADAAVARLVAELTPASAEEPGAVVPLLVEYARWFEDHPALFDLLFTRRRRSQVDFRAVRAAWAGLVAPAATEAGAPPEDLEQKRDLEQEMTALIWAVHGRMLLGAAYPDLMPSGELDTDVAMLPRLILKTDPTTVSRDIEDEIR